MTHSKHLKLIEKYPKLLHTSIIGKLPYDLYGIECGDGWYDIIDMALQQINTYNENPTHVPCKHNKWKIKINDMASKWSYYILKPLSDNIRYKILSKIYFNLKYGVPSNYKPVTIFQIKEKMGSLTIHVTNSNTYVKGILAMAHLMSLKTCEHCGTNKNVTKQGNFCVKSLCKKCHTNRREK